MKKILIVLIPLILALSLGLTACTTETGPSLYNEGLQAVQLMTERTRNGIYNYLEADENVELKIADIQNLAQGDYTAPKTVYSILLSERAYNEYVMIEAMSEVSDNLKEYIKREDMTTALESINSQYDINLVRAADLFSVETSFIDENKHKDLVYIYTFENGNPVAVSFLHGRNDSVRTKAAFLLNPEIPLDSVDSLESYLGELAENVSTVKK